MNYFDIRISARNLHFWLISLGLLGFCARILFILLIPQLGSPTSMDSGTYHSIAVNLLQGKGFSEDGTNPSIFVAPLYPFFIAAIYWLVGAQPLAVELAQCVLGVGIAVLTFLLARKLFGETTALLAFAVTLFFPELFVLCTFLYTETLFITLFLLMIWLALKAMERPDIKSLALAGVVGGLASLTRGVTMLFPGILFAALLTKYRLGKSLQSTIIYALFFALPILPWTIRNYAAFKTFVPIAVGTGDVFWTGNYLPFDGKYNYEKTMHLMDDMTKGMDQIERNERLMAEAKKNIASEPVKSAWLMVRKFFRFWLWIYEGKPTGQQRTGNALVQWILKICYYPILLLFLLGIYWTRNRWRELSLIHWLILYYASIHAIMLVVPRYRFPLLPLMIVFAAEAGLRILAWILDRRRTSVQQVRLAEN